MPVDLRAEMIAARTWGEMVRFAWDVLNFEIFELEGFPISIGKMIFGVVLLIAGYAASRRLARSFDERVLSRLNLDESMRFTLRRFFFYFLFFLSMLLTLRVLHVPLTAFTVIGGALAVGIGFGSQNLVNNFISGLLVMIERPIRVGDYMDIDGLSCLVQVIGFRSTRVRTMNNALVIIPNTTLIQEKLTNWTMSGTIFSRVNFGVAHGTDTTKLREISLAVLVGIEGVVPVPEPSLSFLEIGDNGLLFGLGFHIGAAFFPSRLRIESDVRYRLNEQFIRHGVVMRIPAPLPAPVRSF